MRLRTLLLSFAAVLAIAVAGCDGVDDGGADEKGDTLTTPEERAEAEGDEQGPQDRDVELPPRPAGEVVVEGQIDGSLTEQFTTGFAGTAATSGLNINPSIRATDEGVGFTDLCDGRIDIVDASRAIAPEEVERCERNGLQVVEFQVGYDAAVFATKNETDVGADCVSISELREVYVAGSPIEAWNQIEPFFFPVQLDTAGPDESTSDFGSVFSRILGIPNPTQADLREDYQGFTDEREVKNEVKNNPKGVLGIVGFSLYGQYEEFLRPLEIDNERGDSCVFPSVETISSLLYPFSRGLRLYTTTRGLQRAEVREYLTRFLETAQELATLNDFVALPDPIRRVQLRRIDNPTALDDPNLVDENGVIVAARLPQPEELGAQQDPGEGETPTEGAGGQTTTVPAPGTGGTIAEERGPDADDDSNP